MTAKKTARKLKRPVKPALRPVKPEAKTTFEQRAAAMPRLQVVAPPERAVELDDASPAPSGQLSDKDVILRLVEMLKGL